MTRDPRSIPCIGSVLWDIVGRHGHAMRLGDDRPGRIERLPGGVAMNVAMTLVRFGLAPTVLTCIGTDREGADLVAECTRRGVDTALALRRNDLPTDRYMAIEGMGTLVAAIADARSLEAAGVAILAPLHDGRLGSAADPFGGTAVLDGNLPPALLDAIVADPAFARADLRVVPASPGKALRLRPLLAMPNATLYLNRIEADLMAETTFRSSAEAAAALVDAGRARVIVTDGERAATDDGAGTDAAVTAHPPIVEARRVTGAGDTFMAAHVAAEHAGHNRVFALEAALQAAATYVSGEEA